MAPSPSKDYATVNRISVSVDTLMVARSTRFGFRFAPDILTFITESYGRMSVYACEAQCRRKFGRRGPSKSAIHRYWQWLDEQAGIAVA